VFNAKGPGLTKIRLERGTQLRFWVARATHPIYLQLVVPPTVAAPSATGYCPKQPTSGPVRLPLTVLVPTNSANDRSLMETPFIPFPLITSPRSKRLLSLLGDTPRLPCCY
jgi:hypothetical protein